MRLTREIYLIPATFRQAMMIRVCLSLWD
jgi:hypothetical protein